MPKRTLNALLCCVFGIALGCSEQTKTQSVEGSDTSGAIVEERKASTRAETLRLQLEAERLGHEQLLELEQLRQQQRLKYEAERKMIEAMGDSAVNIINAS